MLEAGRRYLELVTFHTKSSCGASWSQCVGTARSTHSPVRTARPKHVTWTATPTDSIPSPLRF
eukprot:11610113-Alexandrium_andersonii.AAC.1